MRFSESPIELFLFSSTRVLYAHMNGLFQALGARISALKMILWAPFLPSFMRIYGRRALATAPKILKERRTRCCASRVHIFDAFLNACTAMFEGGGGSSPGFVIDSMKAGGSMNVRMRGVSVAECIYSFHRSR